MKSRIFLFLFLIGFIFLGQSETSQKYWVLFKDKGTRNFSKISALRQERLNSLSERTRWRRAKVLPPDNLVPDFDLPVDEGYIDQIRQLGASPLVVSNWLNAVSVFLTPAQKILVQSFNFVREVRPVGRLTRPKPVTVPPEMKTFSKTTEVYTLDYGPSLTQNQLINVPTAHDSGLTGAGVIIGVCDAGFPALNHEALIHLTNNGKILAESNFSAEIFQSNHGSEVLSQIAGYKPGQLIGVAYDASFVLAKTEVNGSETHQEEDNWVAATQWMESTYGVDIITSSLGYSSFDFGQGDYTPTDMDGNTTIITKAANQMTNLGIVVVNSAGNENGFFGPPSIIAPADGFKVIAVGAVDLTGTIASFSSRGPTADGRIKPNVVAMGANNYMVNPGTTNSYWTASGTSFSGPMVAGVCALILQRHPNLTPALVDSALRTTASKSGNPDNVYGWGIVNAWRAATYYDFKKTDNTPPAPPANLHATEIKNTQVTISWNPNTEPDLKYYYIYRGGLFVTQTNSNINQFTDTGLTPGGTYVYAVTAVDTAANQSVPSQNLSIITIANLTTALGQAFPNPFSFSLGNQSILILFQVPSSQNVDFTVYNRIGQRVYHDSQYAVSGNQQSFTWNGKDFYGQKVASGIYFYQIETREGRYTKKLIIIK